MGAGLIQTVDNVAQKCPENTFCDNKNLFECSERSNATNNGTVPTSPLKLDITSVNKSIANTSVSPVNFNTTTSLFPPGPTVYRSCINGVSTLTDVSTVYLDSIALPSITLPCIIPPVINQNQNSGCQRPGQYPDASNCQSYFSCNNNMMFRFYCPFNMVYSPYQQKCTTSKEQCLDSDVFTCNSMGRFPDSKSCYSYYACQGSGYAATRYHCPWYSSFQPSNGHCAKTKTTCDCRKPPPASQNPSQYPTALQNPASPQLPVPPQYTNPSQYPTALKYPASPQYPAAPKYPTPPQNPTPPQYSSQMGASNYYGNSYQPPNPAPAARDVPADRSNIMYSVAPVDNANNYIQYDRPYFPADPTNPIVRYDVPNSGESTRYKGEAVEPIRYNFVPIDGSNSIQQSGPVYSPPSIMSLDRVDTVNQRTPAPTDSSIGYTSYFGEVDNNRIPPYIQEKWSQPVMNESPAFQQWSSTYFGSSNWWSLPWLP